MKAVTYSAYGEIDRLEITEQPVPSPGSGELLVRVTRAALNPKDALFRKGKYRVLSGSRFPKQCGVDYAGVVEASRTPRFRPGQRVFGMLDELSYRRGTLAELVVCKEREAALLPDGVADDAGAALALVALTSLQALRDIGGVLGRPGTPRVLIHGASGGVGTAAIPIARLLGCEVETTSSARNLGLCRELGAARAWDYASGDLQRAAPRFDVIFDVFGNLRFPEVRGWLDPGGRFVSTIVTPGRAVRDVFGRLASVQERFVSVGARREDLDQVAGWLVRGQLRPVIDSRFPLDRVRDAFAVLESKRARGKILVEI